VTVESAIRGFAIDGELVDFEPLVRGHINRTFVSTWSAGGAQRRYLHQCINGHVFVDMAGLMHNVELVTRRLGEALEAKPSGYEALRLVFTREGEHWLAGPDGSWRTYHFVEGTESHDRCAGPEQAFEVARIFGWFQHALSGLDSSALVETIPDFFSPGHRLRQLEETLAAPETAKTGGRRVAAADEIAFVLERRGLLDLFESHYRSGRFPTRVLHGDTKLNNVLFDVKTGRARAVVDLDTAMPGFVLYDFGDMVRFTAATSAEDELDLTQAGTDLELYRALRDGYLDCAADMLAPLERKLLPLAGPLVTLVIGTRFLTDYLAGDVYFGTTRQHHNLDRARVQFAQVTSMEAQREAMG
jgi:hypothetical protein